MKALPKVPFIRHAIAGQLLNRVYWKHWDREGRLILLEIANESLKGVGLRYDDEKINEIKALIDEPSEDEVEVLPGR